MASPARQSRRWLLPAWRCATPATAAASGLTARMPKAALIRLLPQPLRMKATAVAAAALQQTGLGPAAAAMQALSLAGMMAGRMQQQHTGGGSSLKTIW